MRWHKESVVHLYLIYWLVATQALWELPSLSKFISDYLKVLEAVADGPCNTFAYKRLEILEARFQLHLLLNVERELTEQKVFSFSFIGD